MTLRIVRPPLLAAATDAGSSVKALRASVRKHLVHLMSKDYDEWREEERKEVEFVLDSYR